MRAGQVPLRYARPSGEPAERFPDNPNGAEAAVAAVCNGRGNVLAMMPHPERAQDPRRAPARDRGSLGGAPRARGERGRTTLGEPGPGLTLFEGLRRHLEEA